MSSADRLIELFNEANARPTGAERDRFLSEACRDDLELKKQVLSLLHAHEGAGDFLNPTQLLLPVTPLMEKPGDKIGRYKLLQQIGEGGCGVVYMAEQEEPVRRRVALKIIKLGMDTRSVVARFEAEQQALALMDHPCIARVFDAGATETGRPYFVMELVRGIRITDYCDQNNLSTSERLKLFMQVCQAIQHAHQKGVIHRDIKPSNVLVTVDEPGSAGCAKIIDFGIAKATTDQRLTDKTVFTAFQQFIGTPAYMSPEQAAMTTLDVDTRTDIYALGVLLYELLTGNTPFDAETLMASGLDAMRRTIREQEPICPSTRVSTMMAASVEAVANHRRSDAPKLVHQLRGDLDWIVMKALEKDRARRYESADGLARDIERHIKNEPILARRPGAFYRFRRSLHRNRLAYTSATVVLMALVTGLCVATWASLRERDARRQAEAQRQEAELARNLARAEAARNEQIAKFFMTATGPGVWRGQDPTLVRRILDGMSEGVRYHLANQPAAQGDLWVSVGNSYAAMDDYPAAVTNLQHAVAAYRTAFGDEHARLALALARLSRFHGLNHEAPAAKTNAALAVAIARRCNDPETLAVCLLDAAKSYSTAGQPAPEAIPLLRETMQLRRNTVPHLLALLDSTRLLAKALEALASQNRLNEARAILEEELKLAPRDADLLRLHRTLNGESPSYEKTRVCPNHDAHRHASAPELFLLTFAGGGERCGPLV